MKTVRNVALALCALSLMTMILGLPQAMAQISLTTFDLNSDQKIDLNDIAALVPLVTKAGTRGDFNADGKINAIDFGLIVQRYQNPPSPTPSPVASVVPSPTPSGSLQPLGQSGNWNLIFSDEFNGTTLDTAKWEPSWFTGTNISPPINSDEDGCYDPAQVSVSNGSLKLAAVSTTKTNCKIRSGAQAKYASGLINSRKSFTYAYGYMEARMFLPGSNGDIWNWPAFWSDGTGDWPKTGEIDVMESLSGHQPCWHYHYEDSNGNHQGPGGCVNWATPYGWHTFAAHWEPGKVTYYYNGQQVGVITQGIVSDVHFLILNNGVNDRYGINVPATVEVDYVRVWKKQ